MPCVIKCLAHFSSSSSCSLREWKPRKFCCRRSPHTCRESVVEASEKRNGIVVISSSEISDDATNSKLELIVTRTAICQYSLRYFSRFQNFVRTEISQRRYPGLIHACKQHASVDFCSAFAMDVVLLRTMSECNRTDDCWYAHIGL
jgi:hypothetical protein